MTQNYPIDIQGAKNTKLFKKFMESKNKSSLVQAPKIQNIVLNSKNDLNFQQLNNYAKQPRGKNRETNLNSINEENFNQTKVIQNFRPTVVRNYSPNLQINPQRNKQSQEFHSQLYNSQKRKEVKSNDYNVLKDEVQADKKYQKIYQQYQELKQKVANQRKQTKKQFIKMQQQIDMFQKKIFQLRNKQDQLIIQNKRLKQKSTFESKQKQKIEQQNRELTYQIQELKDMLNGQQNSVKKRQDEAMHWRKTNDELKQRIKQLQLQVTRLKDLNNMAQRQKFVAEKQTSNKQQHLNDMRQKINSLITQNGVLRDQIFHITSKLYHFEQENKSLKADLKRHSQDFSVSYMQSQLQHSTNYPRDSSYSQYRNNQQRPKFQNNTETINVQKKTERRRGQFARQRGIRRAQNHAVNNEQKVNISQNNNNQKQKPFQQSSINSKQVSQAIRKLQQLNEQVQKLKDLKAMNGAMRRQKINLQREIQQIQEFLKSKQ